MKIAIANHIKEGDMLALDLDINNRITIKRIDSTIDIELISITRNFV